jgi:hypothetical protein
MTATEAIEIARKVAVGQGWPWEDPIHAMRRRRGWLSTGRFWDVLSNARSRGNNVSITIDNSDATVLNFRFLARALNDSSARVTEFEAIEIARNIAATKGWPWKEPVHATFRQPSWLRRGAGIWEILSNADCLGCNVFVTVDEITGKAVLSGFRPR